MARSEARIQVDIWDDGDFLALSPGAQRLFMFLLSQRDLAHTGVLALRERRWAKGAAGLTVAAVSEALEELAAARFVVVDDEEEELLIRSFMRGDRVYRQPNVLRSACDHLPLISSKAILAEIKVELERIAATEDLNDRCKPIVDEMLKAIDVPLPDPPGKGSANPSDVPTPNPSGNPSDMPTRGAPGDRGVLRGVSSASPNPESSNPGGTAPLESSGGGQASQPPPGDSSPRSWTETLLGEHCAKQRRPPPAKERTKIAEQIHALLADDQPFTPDEIRTVLDSWASKPLGPGAIGSIADELFCRDATVTAIDRQRDRPPQGGADANLAGHAALVAELQAAEGGAR